MVNTMKTFETIEKELADKLGINMESSFPKKEYTYYAYKNGQATEFKTRELASHHSKMVEAVQINVDSFNNAVALYKEWDQSVKDTFKQELRNEFPEVNDKQFEILYTHVSKDLRKYDDFYEQITDLVDIHHKLLKAV